MYVSAEQTRPCPSQDKQVAQDSANQTVNWHMQVIDLLLAELTVRRPMLKIRTYRCATPT